MTTINKEVVEMVFDARKFHSGVRTTLESISSLKKSLNFDRQIKNFADLTPAANNVDFSRMGSTIEGISNKLSIMGVVGATVIANLTTSLIDATKNLVSKVLVQPIKEGLSEYETQINSIQTILANTSTKGTTLDDVTVALDTLNAFADRTIYNFTQMTDSIGKFTAAGVDLDVSVGAIKGIANLAAVSGSNAQQASTAMYQLSQAISTGVVKLQDWNSVVNAGLGGEVFKNALIETARVHDVAIDQMIESSGGFRNTLQEGWLTSDILLETLNKFTGDLTDAQLESMGYTEEQIKGIQEMAQTALGAATDIKTVTQLADTLYEALQSGWSGTWRIIFGDFNEAKVLFGAVGDQLGTIISESAEARNKQLAFWAAAGGRETTINSFLKVMTGLLNVGKLFKEAVSDVFTPFDAGSLLAVTNRISEFIEKFKIGENSGERFQSIIRGIASAIDVVFIVVKAILKPFSSLLGTVGKGADDLASFAANMGDLVYQFRNNLKSTDDLDNRIASLVDRFKQLGPQIKQIRDNFVDLEIVQTIIKTIKDLDLGNPVSRLALMQTVLANVNARFQVLREVVIAMYGALVRVAEGLLELEVVQKFIDRIGTFDGSRMIDFFNNLQGNFGWVKRMFEIMASGSYQLPQAIAALGENLGSLGVRAGEAVRNLVGTLAEAAGKLDWLELIRVINAGLLSAILISVNSLFGDGDIVGQLVKSLFGEDVDFGSSITGAFGQLESTLVSFQNNLKADSLLKIAGAITLITASATTLSYLDPKRLSTAAVAMGTIMAALFAGISTLSAISGVGLVGATTAIIGISGALLIITAALAGLAAIGPEKATSALLIAGIALTGLVGVLKLLSVGPMLKGVLLASVAMVVMSGALLVLSGALLAIGSLPYSTIEKGLITIGIALAGFAGFAQIIAGGKLAVAAVGVAAMSAALVVMSLALKSLGSISWEELLRGLVAMAGSLVIVAGALHLFRGVGLGAVNMAVASASLLLLADAMSQLGDLSWSEIARALVALGGALIIIVGALYLMTGAIAGAAALVVVSGAILILSSALTALGNLSWEGILKSLAALAGVLVLFGIAGLTMGPIIPILLGLGAAMALIGVGALALGAGLLLASLGLTALAASGGAVAGVIIGVVAALITVLPSLVLAMASAITNFIIEMGKRTPDIIAAGVAMLGGLITAIVEVIPLIVEGIYMLLDALLTAAVEYLPNIIEMGWTLLKALLEGMANHIGDVVEQGLAMVTAIIKGLTAGIPSLIDAAFELILAFIDGMADSVEEYYPQIVASGLRLAYAIIEGAVKGLKDGLTDIKNSIIEVATAMINSFKEMWGINSPSTVAYDLIVDIVTGMINAFSDNLSKIKNKAKELGNKAIDGAKSAINSGMQSVKDVAGTMGQAIIDGISDKLQGGITSLANKMIAVANAAINGFKQAWGINSPSKVSQGFATNIVTSFTDRLDRMSGGLVKSVNDLGEKAQNGMGLVMSTLSAIVADSDLSPTIRPVLDTGAIDSGLSGLTSRFNTYSLASSISGDIRSEQRRSARDSEKPSEVTNETNVTYNQYNTSPSDLKPAEIYRRTESQLARLKRNT